jgi:cyclopropane-fatty-acyl-phospholipid synthase
VSRGHATARVEALLAEADVRIGGKRPWDIRVHEERFFDRALREGILGLGESYMDGWWECDRLDRLFHRILEARLERRVRTDWRLAGHLLLSRVSNLQTRRRSRQVAERHYDLSAELYLSFLDPYNQYTCAYYEDGYGPHGKGNPAPEASPTPEAPVPTLPSAPDAGTSARRGRVRLDVDEDVDPDLARDGLDRAQERKLDLICRKLALGPGDRVLDIGCGWGGFARFAAERHGCRVTGVTISATQAEHARKVCRGLDVEILECDYRELPGRIAPGAFGRVLVCGMIEHVGYKNYRALFRAVRHCLAADGLFLLHTIGAPTSGTTMDRNRFIAKYVFPNSMIPSLRQLTDAAEGLLRLEDLHDFGPSHYDRTLLAWWRNFQRSWEGLSARYDERFYRMWEFYLLPTAGGFRACRQTLWHLVFSRDGLVEGYGAVR